MKKLSKYSACFANPVTLKRATQEMRRLTSNGVSHLLFEFILISKVEHHEPDEQHTDIMNACDAYNWIAGQYQAVCITCTVMVQLYK